MAHQRKTHPHQLPEPAPYVPPQVGDDVRNKLTGVSATVYAVDDTHVRLFGQAGRIRVLHTQLDKEYTREQA